MSYLKLFFIQILLVIMSLDAIAQFNPIHFEKEVLDNGLTVIYHRDTSLPVVSVVTHYKVGSSDESKKHTGYAHFFEHLMFSETENIPSGNIEMLIQDAGGNINAHTSFEETVYKITIPSNNLPLALWVESERMRKLKISDHNVNKEKKVVIEEKRLTIDNAPYGNAFPTILKEMFNDTPYEWSVIGNDEHIENAETEDFIEFYNNFYRPNNAIISISGNFDLDTAKNLIQNYFSEFERNDIQEKYKYDLKQIEERTIDLSDKYADLPAVFIAYYGPSLQERNFAFDVLLQILSDGESSRLEKRLVNKDELAVSVGMMPVKFDRSGVAIFVGMSNIGISPEKIKDAFLEEIDNIIENGISDDELQKAKNNIEVSFVASKYESIHNAQILAKAEALFEDPGIINTDLRQYLKVDKDDVKDVAKDFFKKQPNVILYINPEND